MQLNIPKINMAQVPAAASKSISEMFGISLHSKVNQAEITQCSSFVEKLYKIVDDPSTDHIITWDEPIGDTFSIKQNSVFCDQILPTYFKHNTFASFIRQLNMYDFHKARMRNSTVQIFSHEHFQKGKMKELCLIKRKK